MPPAEVGSVLKPSSADQVLELVAWAAAEEARLEVIGGGSKRGLGRPLQATHELDLSALSGITLYEPEELVLAAGAGTPLATIEAALAEHRQQLAFEPADYGPLYGGEPDRQTLGGVIACNLSGPRRLKAGAARDHFLGLKAVSGRGEAFKAGGRVMKNVTGYDLCKLICGSYGTLAVMTEVTVKVLPAAETTHTVLVFGLDDEAAIRAMAQALLGPHEVSGAAHLPAEPAARSSVPYVRDAAASVTALRVEGPRPSVTHRAAALKALMAEMGEVEELHSKNSALMWRELRDLAPFAATPERLVWRLSVPPASGAKVVAAIRRQLEATAFYDWSGGLIWLALPPSDDAGHRIVRGAVAETGGHATLLRAPAAVRAAVPVFQPQDGPLAALSARVKAGFDPRGVLNPGRMYPET
ncbi:MAG: glycolate oxidase subunit GlcE [Kiloniellales bacterium]